MSLLTSKSQVNHGVSVQVVQLVIIIENLNSLSNQHATALSYCTYYYFSIMTAKHFAKNHQTCLFGE